MEKDENIKRQMKLDKNKIIIYVLGLFILIYLFYAVYLLVKQPTNKVTVEKGTLYLEETNIGYVIRNEVVVQGENYNGTNKNRGRKNI